MAIEGIGAAAHVPADAEGNRTAIGSAIFAAVGARPRHLPIRPEAVRQALAAKT
jgi:CO/xanthine dehydrogenase Mo-binding subunit